MSVTHGKACLLHFIATAVPILALTDLPPEVKAAIGYVEPYIPPEGVPPVLPDWPYLLQHGAVLFERHVHTKDGVETTRHVLAGFDAWVEVDETLDDGTGVESHVFHVRGWVATDAAYPGPLPMLAIPASKFDRLDWVTEGWGTRAIVFALPGAQRYHLARAIQTRIKSTLRRIYTHTGYIDAANGTGLYLSATGAVGHDGYEVDLGHGTNLQRYALPAHPNRVVEGLTASLALLEVAPAEIMIPLLGAVWRAPLASAVPCDFSLWLVGETGARKSSLAAVVLCHYGDFPTKSSLPLHWSWTAPALEQGTFRLKDALIVIDDYAPDKLDPRDVIGKAQRLVRALGNVAGRGRLGRDLTERAPRPPRGLVISTGEAFPPGESIAARTLILRLEREAIDLDALTLAQDPIPRESLAHGLAGYVDWLGQRFGNGFAGRLADELTVLRRKAQRADQHPRVPEIVANLQLGWIYGLDFAVSVGALDPAMADTYKAEAWTTLLKVGHAQGKLVEERQPARVFLEILSALLEQQRAVLLPHDKRPEEIQLPGREILGWHDQKFLYLIPKATFREIGRYCRDAGETFPVPEDQLDRILVDHGLAEAPDDSYRGRLRASVGGKQRRVLKLNRAAIVKFIGPFGVPALPGSGMMPEGDPEGTSPF